MEEVEKAYIAGIIDGEGTVSLIKHHRNETPAPLVSVANNKLELLQWIKKRVGGTIINKRKNKPYHDNSYAWSLRFDSALNFLKLIKKYLILKLPQTELILKNYKAVTKRSGKYTLEALNNKMKLVTRIRELNQRKSMPPIISRAPEIKSG